MSGTSGTRRGVAPLQGYERMHIVPRAVPWATELRPFRGKVRKTKMAKLEGRSSRPTLYVRQSI